jgi:hypothetical protein
LAVYLCFSTLEVEVSLLSRCRAHGGQGCPRSRVGAALVYNPDV